MKLHEALKGMSEGEIWTRPVAATKLDYRLSEQGTLQYIDSTNPEDEWEDNFSTVEELISDSWELKESETVLYRRLYQTSDTLYKMSYYYTSIKELNEYMRADCRNYLGPIETLILPPNEKETK